MKNSKEIAGTVKMLTIPIACAIARQLFIEATEMKYINYTLYSRVLEIRTGEDKINSKKFKPTYSVCMDLLLIFTHLSSQH
jgi:hypothetical protein